MRTSHMMTQIGMRTCCYTAHGASEWNAVEVCGNNVCEQIAFVIRIVLAFCADMISVWSSVKVDLKRWKPINKNGASSDPTLICKTRINVLLGTVFHTRLFCVS
mmetsp:Transcript_5180/g.9041  ORF Transcript_5180/g.9041 Transcript_5180/m.9041 type:complete len:104 (+) Transcript_5180:803-1114(+)